MQLVENANEAIIGTQFMVSLLTLFATAFGNSAADVRNCVHFVCVRVCVCMCRTWGLCDTQCCLFVCVCMCACV